MQKNKFYQNYSLLLKGKLITIDKPLIMGILNITENSFFDGNKYNSDVSILSQVEKMLNEGTDIIDIGACSTKPGAKLIDEKTELTKIKHVTQLILKHFPETIISIDTFRANVAKIAVENGASLINDISGGELDPKMFETIAKLKVPYVLMHMRGTPETMSNFTNYENLMLEICKYFNGKIETLKKLGVNDIIIDPGFGFAKTKTQNFELLRRLNEFSIFDKPILVGISRKSSIYKTLECTPDEALNGTTVLNTLALNNGASILRVHDVNEAKEAIILVNEYYKTGNGI